MNTPTPDGVPTQAQAMEDLKLLEWVWPLQVKDRGYHSIDRLRRFIESHPSPAGVVVPDRKRVAATIDRACALVDAMPEFQSLLALRQYEHDSDLGMDVTVPTATIDGAMYDVRDALCKLLDAPAMLNAAPTQGAASGGVGREGRDVRAWVSEMKLSGDRTEWWVCVGHGREHGEYLSVRVSSIRGRTEYEVAEWNHMLGHGPEPDILAFDTDPPPDVEPKAEERQVASAAGAAFSRPIEDLGTLEFNDGLDPSPSVAAPALGVDEVGSP